MSVPLSHIVLASTSPRRLELLRSLGLCVEVVASGYEESSTGRESPAELATRHAFEKLRAVLYARGEAGIDGTPLGKPANAAEAERMLERLSGREHLVHTAFALTVPGRAEQTRERSTTRVRFYPLEPDEIAEYVASGEPLDKAGAYGIQGRAAALVEAIDGDFYTVMGLPLARVVRALRRLGFTLPKPK
jgi:septum formation protein